MSRENYGEILAFIAVAREKSFTKAAAHLGVSQSALSHTIRSLENRLDIRLLTRTTRSVSVTEAGERLLKAVAPRFEEIDAEIEALSELRDKPAGTIRISAGDHAVETILWPKLNPLLKEYPEIIIELNVDYGLTDIVTQRLDAGVRFGEQVEKDMIAVPIGPEARIAVVGSPEYMAGRYIPMAPQDLLEHRCINMRLPTYGGLYAWELEKDGRELNVRVEGSVIVNTVPNAIRAALDGHGLSYLPEDIVLPHINEGRLVRVLEDWCPPFPGYHLYYPNRRRSSPAFSLVVDALRYAGED